MCKDCTRRTVGCHASCQLYVVNKVIRTYKQNKKFNYDEACYNPLSLAGECSKLKKRLNR